MKTQVVLYLLDGHFHATRHVDTCGVLRRAVAASEGTVRPGRGDRPSVFDDAAYVAYSRQRGVLLVPRDHSCVAKAGAML